MKFMVSFIIEGAGTVLEIVKSIGFGWEKLGILKWIIYANFELGFLNGTKIEI